MDMSAFSTPAKIVAGIDPGLASGGFVIIDRSAKDRVLAAFSFVEKSGSARGAKEAARVFAEAIGGWGDLGFLSADLRARAWITRFLDALDEFERDHEPVQVFAIESFVDQAQHAKKMLQKRWQTPFTIGMLINELGVRGATPTNGRIIYQDAGRVLRQFSEEIGRLQSRGKAERDVVVAGDRVITHEHQRSALAHALALSLRLPPYPSTHKAAIETNF
jgi:hypothetical protein